jgi:hypothetical protein
VSGNPENTDSLIDSVIRAQMLNVNALAEISTRFVADRVKQEAGTVTLDPATGALLGALSAAALAAKAALEEKIILKGGEPGHGL